MRKQLLAVAVLVGVLVAAGRGPDPVITVAGTTAAVKLSASQQAALAPRVKALDTALQKAVAAKGTSARAGAGQQTVPHVTLEGVHEECLRLYHEIGEQLDPEQRAAFMAYLHQQMTAAGLDPAVFHHAGGHVPHVSVK